MPARNTVSIQMDRRLAGAVGSWLIASYRPRESLAGTNADDNLASALRIGKQFEKAAKRKRLITPFSVSLKRDDASWFAHAFLFMYRPLGAWFGDAPEPILYVARACHEAIRTRRGNPKRLSETELAREIEQRNRGGRWRRRLKARKQLDDWFRALDARGETLVTATIPCPIAPPRQPQSKPKPKARLVRLIGMRERRRKTPEY